MNEKAFRVIRTAVHGILVVSLILYFWKWVDIELVDFNQQPLFLFNYHFFHNYLAFPGGFAGYLALFFSQFFHYPFAGTCIVIIFLYLTVLSTNRILKGFFPEDYVFILQFIPLFLLVSLHSLYSHTLKPDIILIMTLYPAVLYKYLIGRPYYFKIPFFILLSLLLILFFGGNSLMLFGLLAVILEIINKKKKYIPVILVFIIVSISLPLIIGRYTPYMNTGKVVLDIFMPETHYTPVITLYLLFLFYPVVLLLGMILVRKSQKSLFSGHPGKIMQITARLIQLALPVIILIISMKLSFNRTEKALIELNYFADKKDWESVLKTAEMLPPENRIVIFQINRALYHTGNLMNNLFSYKQFWGEEGLLLTKHFNRKLLIQISDIYFELGYIKESLHWAYERQTEYESSPLILKRIVITNLILGEYKIAAKFLKILSESIVHRKWAVRYLHYLDDPALIDADPVIREKRNLMPKNDFFAHNDEPILDLQYLINENPSNKMAFEYLIACSLLKHDLGNIIKNLHYMRDLNYSKIPRHMEEAILTFMVMQNTTKINLYGYTINNETVKRFTQYSNLLFNKYNNNKESSKNELYRYFGNTFWFYIHYISPITTKREFKEKVAR